MERGLVQTITPLVYNTSLKITTAKYYTPSGRCIQKIDYSKKNDVIAQKGSVYNSSFTTDNKRTVFSAGGITPDTMVVDENTSGIVKFLLSKGLFFKFANQYAGQNDKDKFENAGGDKLFNEFEKFLNHGLADYKSDQLKKVEQLIDAAKSDNSSNDVL